MPINNIGNSVTSLPVASRDNRLRLQSLDIEEQNSNGQNNRRAQADLVQASDDVQRVTRSSATAEPAFRPVPSFDELPTNLRDALQSYLATAQVTEPVSNDGSELLVGVDTFV